jgi:hypothetical protein
MRRTTYQAVALAFTALMYAVPHNAWAFFTDQKLKPAGVKVAFEGFGRSVVSQIGAGAAQARQSHGAGVPLDDALRMLAPNGWRIDAKAAGNPKVHWRAGAKTTWVQALSQIGSNSGLRFLVDWRHKTLYVAKEKGAVMHALAPNKAAQVAAVHKHPGPAPVPTWVIHPTRSIQANLSTWAAKAGWKILWSGQTWMPAAGATFTGGFLDAVQGVLGALRAQGADVRAEAFGNHVLVIHTVAGDAQ